MGHPSHFYGEKINFENRTEFDVLSQSLASTSIAPLKDFTLGSLKFAEKNPHIALDLRKDKQKFSELSENNFITAQDFDFKNVHEVIDLFKPAKYYVPSVL